MDLDMKLPCTLIVSKSQKHLKLITLSIKNDRIGIQTSSLKGDL
jgi:hypothetical protein